MGTIKHFEDIEAWKTARALSLSIYTVTNQKPFSRDFGLMDQIRRSTVSIMSNIAEGFESQTDKTFIRYLGIAKSSAGEVRSQIYTALDQNYISKKNFIQYMTCAVEFPAKYLSSSNTWINPTQPPNHNFQTFDGF